MSGGSGEVGEGGWRGCKAPVAVAEEVATTNALKLGLGDIVVVKCESVDASVWLTMREPCGFRTCAR